MNDKRFALLIDAENISARYIDCILDEVTKYGMITYKRIYGDWTNPHTTKWKETLVSNSINPVQQFSNTTGKNATDSTLIIDAMDILYTGHVDGFSIVSSDSDFTRLASRLRESGMIVIGMGENKTPRSFRVACTEFKDLNVLYESENDYDEEKLDSLDLGSSLEEQGNHGTKLFGETTARRNDIVEKEDVLRAVSAMIQENDNKGKETSLGEVGSRLVNKYPDFDVRNYGYTLLSAFLNDIPELTLKKNGSILIVCLQNKSADEEKIRKYVVTVVKASGAKGMDVSELSNRVHTRFGGFRVKDYGYSQFSKFVQNIQGLDVKETNAKNRKRVYTSTSAKQKK